MFHQTKEVERFRISHPAEQPHSYISIINSAACAAHLIERDPEMSKKPHQDTQLAQFVERRILELRTKKTQGEIAAQAGFNNANMVTMIKQGKSKAALDRIPGLARALECDPAYLMRLALEQAIGRTAAAAVIEIFGEPITENETTWIKAIRAASDNSDPRMTSRSQAAINAIFGR